MSEETQNPSPEEQDVDQVLPETEATTDAAEASEPAAEADTAAAEVDPIAELTEDLQRMTAEYANYRRRAERDRAAAVESAQVSVIASLLPVLDDLDLAKQHGDLEGPLKALNDKLRAAVASFKVEAFGAAGEAFNPERHEAVQDSSTGDEKVIGTVLRCGYALGERVIRTAMVIIADPEAPADASEDA
ncbi:MAG: nucleotide exchange factor GrpE [Corynebacterium sp.]|nr:nucleotide exchange factor GrpE [Corynebacterium sp.]